MTVFVAVVAAEVNCGLERILPFHLGSPSGSGRLDGEGRVQYSSRSNTAVLNRLEYFVYQMCWQDAELGVPPHYKLIRPIGVTPWVSRTAMHVAASRRLLAEDIHERRYH